MTSLSQAVEHRVLEGNDATDTGLLDAVRRAAQKNGWDGDAPGSFVDWLNDEGFVVRRGRLTPTEDVREGVEKIIENWDDIESETPYTDLKEAITAFITAREAAKDAEIAEAINQGQIFKRERDLLRRERDRLAARLEKMKTAAKWARDAFLDMEAGVLPSRAEFDAILLAALADEDGSTTVPARETALHDTEGE